MFNDTIRYGGGRARGFSLAAAGDSAVSLTGDQLDWVINSLSNLNAKIVAAHPDAACRNWQEPRANMGAAIGCFQLWYNANANGSLRTDGTLDEDTLCALTKTTTSRPQDFPTPFPDPTGQFCRGAAAPPPAPPAPPPAPVAPPPPPAAPVAPATPPAPAAPAEVPPTPPAPIAPAPSTHAEKKKLGTAAMVGIGVGAAAVVGGVIYAATSKGGGRRRRRR